MTDTFTWMKVMDHTDFVWNPKTKKLISDVSLLQLKYGALPPTLHIRGKKEALPFDLVNIEDNGDEIVSWNYVNERTGIRVVIFND